MCDDSVPYLRLHQNYSCLPIASRFSFFFATVENVAYRQQTWYSSQVSHRDASFAVDGNIATCFQTLKVGLELASDNSMWGHVSSVPHPCLLIRFASAGRQSMATYRSWATNVCVQYSRAAQESLLYGEACRDQGSAKWSENSWSVQGLFQTWATEQRQDFTVSALRPVYKRDLSGRWQEESAAVVWSCHRRLWYVAKCVRRQLC